MSTTQTDGRVLSSVVNCGVTNHPLTARPCVALVSGGNAARLRHIRRGSEVTIAIRRGWRWVSVTGASNIVGPNNPAETLDAEAIRMLLRQVFQAAGGTYDDWDEYDRAMSDDARAAVFVSPDRIIGNL